MAERKRKKKKGKRFTFLYILGGGILKEEFILKHIKMIVLCVILSFFFIGNRYSCIQKISKIDRLRKELHDLELEALTVSTELTGKTKISQVEDLVRKHRIDIATPVSPPYELYK
jgi:hypothetical protein